MVERREPLDKMEEGWFYITMLHPSECRVRSHHHDHWSIIVVMSSVVLQWVLGRILVVERMKKALFVSCRIVSRVFQSQYFWCWIIREEGIIWGVTCHIIDCWCWLMLADAEMELRCNWRRREELFACFHTSRCPSRSTSRMVARARGLYRGDVAWRRETKAEGGRKTSSVTAFALS